MKFNNKLSLVDYIQVVDAIANEYFNLETYEYNPHFGEMYAVFTFYNLCAELEDKDKEEGFVHPMNIENAADVEKLFNNEEFMDRYHQEIYNIETYLPSLTFAHAFSKAMDIVEHRRNDVNAISYAISASFDAILKSFKESFTEDEIGRIEKIAKDIKDGAITNDSILSAYENSNRFKANTADLNKTIVIPK